MAGLLSDRFEDLQYRGAILPFGRTKKGSTVFATPGLLVDAIKSMELPGRALRGENISADDVTKMAMDTMGGGGLLSRAVPTGDVGGLLGMNVFHGTPRKFESEPNFPMGRPRSDMGGTGLGQQAYMPGFYSTKSQPHSKFFRDSTSKLALKNITPDEQQILQKADYELVQDVLNIHGNLNADPTKRIQGLINRYTSKPEVSGVLQKVQAGLKPRAKNFEYESSGSQYKLDLPDADAARHIDYEKSAKALPPEQKAAVQELAQEFNISDPVANDRGVKFFLEDLIVAAGSQEAAVAALKSKNFPGLSYKDENVRNVKNYVTWDQDVLDRTKILERDGKPTSANAEPRLPSDIRPAKENLATVVDANTVGGRVAGDETVSIDLLAGGASRSARAQKDIDNIADSMSGPDGFIERLIVDQDNNVIEGAHRLEALRKLGVKEVPVTRIIDPQASLTGDDIAAMKNAMSKVSPIHSDHKNQIITQLGEMLADPDVAGDLSKVSKVFDLPKGFEKHFEAALKILDRN